MLRHRTIGVFTALVFTLVLGAGIVAPVAAQAPVSDQVVITATIADMLEVQFPDDLDYGTLPVNWNAAAYPDGIYQKTLTATLVISSTRQYYIGLGGDDQSVGTAYGPDFFIGFQGGGYVGGLNKDFSAGSQDFGPYPLGIAVPMDWQFTIIMYSPPVTAGTIHYVLTFLVTQI